MASEKQLHHVATHEIKRRVNTIQAKRSSLERCRIPLKGEKEFVVRRNMYVLYVYECIYANIY